MANNPLELISTEDLSKELISRADCGIVLQLRKGLRAEPYFRWWCTTNFDEVAQMCSFASAQIAYAFDQGEECEDGNFILAS